MPNVHKTFSSVSAGLREIRTFFYAPAFSRDFYNPFLNVRLLSAIEKIFPTDDDKAILGQKKVKVPIWKVERTS